jgi:uncharacterized 2Fe-2S/4Fe-4S cluster protein (DUF4445 family)
MKMAGASEAEKCNVLFQPDNIAVKVEKGSNLLEAARAGGVQLSASCGGAGVCGTCKIKIQSGEFESRKTAKLSDEEYRNGVRQACQTRVVSDLVVTVPPESRLEKAVQSRERGRSSGVSATDWKFDPPVKKYYLELPPPNLKDNATDLSRLMRVLQKDCNVCDLPLDFNVIRSLPGVLREDDWKVTVTTLVEPAVPHSQSVPLQRITCIEAGDTRGDRFVLAVDIGTTTVCGQILDLNRGKIVSDSLVFNKQISFGSDVISRIAYSQKPGGLRKLQEAVITSLNELLDFLLEHGKISRKDISHITIAGNTTMTQLLLGIDPKYVRLTPYIPAAAYIPPVKANSLGIKVEDEVYLSSLPSISSYVGGDIVAGVIASGLHQRSKLTFFMDIGTNGEIVLGNSDWLVTASCSAGPAFEGGGIKHGMVAMSGAIQDFSLDPVSLEPTIRTIGDARPKGICGSGLINTICALLENGVIGQNGKFESQRASPRIREGADGFEYVLSWEKETQIGQDIVITEVDIDNLMRAKAAMYAGFQTLANSVNLKPEDFEQVILAGNFGSSLNVEKAVMIGLLPDIPRHRFFFIGNASLSGARLVSYSTDLLNDSRRVAQMMTNIELSENVDFSHNYVAALFLPHTDEKAFPSVFEKLNNRGK